MMDNQDSVTGSPTDPRTLHRYAYAFGNPVNYTDPSGLMPFGRGGRTVHPQRVAPPATSYAVAPQTQVGHLGPAALSGGGFNSAHLGQADLSFTPPNRSVNGAGGRNWQPYSDPYAKQQSKGYRPETCGPANQGTILDTLYGLRDTAQVAVDFLQNGAEAFQDDPLAFAQKAENWIYEGWKWTGRRIVHQWQTGWAELKAAPGAVIHRTWQETRVAISLALDVIPVVGDIKGVIEAKVGTDLAGHKLTEFEKGLMLAASLVGMFTIADELMDAAKLGRQFLNNADNATDLLKASKGLDNLDEAADIAKNIDNSLLKHADDLDNAKATFRNADDLAIANRLDNLDDFTGGRRTADEAAQVRDRLARSSDQGALSRRLDDARARRQADEVGASCAFNSFTEGTPVHTDEGQKPIEEIEVGDKVLAEDPDTGDDKRGYFEVVALTSHAEADILHITIEAEAKDKAEKTATLDSGQDHGHNDRQQLNSETMEITPDHPVYVEGQGWLWAENLAVGDTLRRADGGMARVLAIDRLELAEAEVVYNFTVQGPHTYFVLEVGVLVHNCGPAADVDARLDNLDQFTGGNRPRRPFSGRPSGTTLSDRIGMERPPTNLDDIFLLRNIAESRSGRGASGFRRWSENVNTADADNLIELYGFRGTGRTAEEFIESDPLIYAGHIGISFDEGKTIYGFTPFAPGLSNAEAIEVLKQHKSFPGQVLDDTDLFHRAQDLAEQGYRTQVYVQSIPISKAEFERIKTPHGKVSLGS